MRVLVSVYGAYAHIQPMIPLAQALQAAGHETRVACQARMAPLLTEAGLTPLPLYEDAEFPITEEELTEKSRIGVERLLAACAEWTPDVVVREWSELAGLMVAVEHGLPCVACGIKIRPPARSQSEHPCLSLMETVMGSLAPGGGLNLNRLMSRQTAVLGRLGAAAGPPSIDLSLLFGDLWLSFYPPSLAWPSTKALSREHFFRPPVQHDGIAGEPAPAWLDDLPRRPLVYATLGTSINQMDGVFERIIAAAAGLDVELVVTVGRDRDPEQLGPVPGNVHVTRYIPHSTIMPRATAAIIHGGFSTMLGALTHGVPFVCIPVNGDQPLNAQRAAELGVALSCVEGDGLDLDVRAPDIDPEVLRGLLRRVLDEPAFTTAAKAVAAEIAALPPIDESVPLIEKLAGA